MADPAHVVLIGIDIETLGRAMVKHPLVAIGVCLATLDKGVIEKRTWCMQPEAHQEPEKRCMDEFWSKHADVLERIQKHAKPLGEQMLDFNAWLLSVEKRFPASEGYRIVVLSDNPSFDVGHIDYWLETKCGAPPLHYSRDGTRYNSIVNPDDMLSMAEFDKQRIGNHLAIATHWPEDDAEYIVVQMFIVYVLKLWNLELTFYTFKDEFVLKEPTERGCANWPKLIEAATTAKNFVCID